MAVGDRTYTLADIAQLLNISLVTAKRWKASGKIPPPAFYTHPQTWSYDQVTQLIQAQTNKGK